VTFSCVFEGFSRVDLQAISDPLLLLVDALDGLLSSEALFLNSEDALLGNVFTDRHPPLLRHIWWEFVSQSAIATLFQAFALCGQIESLWRAIGNRLSHPLLISALEFDSLIVSEDSATT
jgi:hypothetical protein